MERELFLEIFKIQVDEIILPNRRVPIFWLGSYSTLLMFIANHIYIINQ